MGKNRFQLFENLVNTIYSIVLLLIDDFCVQLCVVGVTISLYLCSAVARVAIPLSVVDRHKDYG